MSVKPKVSLMRGFCAYVLQHGNLTVYIFLI